jgi:beta-lactamase class C
MWNSESSLPSALVPTILDRALGITGQRWLREEFEEPTLYVQNGVQPDDTPGTAASKSTAAPY